MPLFDLTRTPVKMIKVKMARDEQEIHTLISENLETILGVRYLQSEYKFSTGRIDTLGIDENNSPVIVEYKKAKSSDVIIQALYYKNWLMDHKAAFKLLCKEKLKEDIKIDWADPRVIIIARDFNKWDKRAVQQMGGNIELKRYRLYENNMLYLEDLIVTTKGKGEVTPLSQNLEEFIKSKQPRKETEELFRTLTSKIAEISDDLRIVIGKSVVSYRTTRNFVSVQPQKTQLTLHLTFQELPENLEIFKNVYEHRKHCHFSVKEKDLDTALKLIRKAYEETL